MSALGSFARFWWDFVVGDDWRVAAGVLAALCFGALLAATDAASDGVIGAVVTAGLLGAVAVTLLAPAGRR
jgi:hypothetical protein